MGYVPPTPPLGPPDPTKKLPPRVRVESDDDNAGQIGLGMDLSGNVEPSMGIGGGLGIDLDGDITIQFD